MEGKKHEFKRAVLLEVGMSNIEQGMMNVEGSFFLLQVDSE